MPEIEINGKLYSYNEENVLHFVEGLIGLPNLKQAVLIPLDDYEPFCWLASLNDEQNRFLVVNPSEIFADYNENLSLEISLEEKLEKDQTKILAIVKMSSEWQQTTINLRAPIIVNCNTKKAAQLILSNTKFQHSESLPQT